MKRTTMSNRSVKIAFNLLRKSHRGPIMILSSTSVQISSPSNVLTLYIRLRLHVQAYFRAETCQLLVVENRCIYNHTMHQRLTALFKLPSSCIVYQKWVRVGQLRSAVLPYAARPSTVHHPCRRTVIIHQMTKVLLPLPPPPAYSPSAASAAIPLQLYRRPLGGSTNGGRDRVKIAMHRKQRANTFRNLVASRQSVFVQQSKFRRVESAVRCFLDGVTLLTNQHHTCHASPMQLECRDTASTPSITAHAAPRHCRPTQLFIHSGRKMTSKLQLDVCCLGQGWRRW